jgi:hypothetical protein
VLGKSHYDVYGNAFRAKRLRAFLALADDVLTRKPLCRVLDIGGEKAYWMGLEDVWRGRNLDITLVNIGKRAESEGRFTCVFGDARDLKQFSDNSFDIVHSNSVIEHVGVWSDKRRMAAEVCRLAPFYFIQTPNYWFPFEPHLRMPFIHWLPQPWQRRIVMLRACGFYSRACNIDEAHKILSDAILLDAPELRSLFPDARIVRERLGPFTKSLIAVRCGVYGAAA